MSNVDLKQACGPSLAIGLWVLFALFGLSTRPANEPKRVSRFWSIDETIVKP